jgi:hypothetical protein
MLDSIKGGGFQLKKSANPAQSKLSQPPKPTNDVASILQRRIALEMSDSEEESGDEEGDDWD